MRKVLFRGYIKYPSDIINGFWYGDLIHYANGDIYIRQFETGMENEVIPESVGQFTGVVDKNGVEIYEGDYLIDRFPIDEEDLSKGYNDSLLPVVWCDKQLMWCVDVSFEKNGSYLTSLVEYFGIENLEVAG